MNHSRGLKDRMFIYNEALIIRGITGIVCKLYRVILRKKRARKTAGRDRLNKEFVS
jgi:hypothetical protein